MSLRKQLESKLGKKQLLSLRRAFDVVGNIAIVEIPSGLKSKEKLIGNAILESNKNITTVVKKLGKRTSLCRIQKTKIIAGRRSKETIYVENGVRIKLHIDKTYFSPRLSGERLRIARLVRPNENILVMFSGVAPYPLVISKHSAAATIVGVEINKTAHKYALENLKLNKMSNIRLINGDAKKIVPALGKFDRIIMPLPKTSIDFLPAAISAAKKGSVIHFYDFEHESEIIRAGEKVKKACRKCQIVGVVKCGQISPRNYRVCVDFIVK